MGIIVESGLSIGYPKEDALQHRKAVAFVEPASVSKELSVELWGHGAKHAGVPVEHFIALFPIGFILSNRK